MQKVIINKCFGGFGISGDALYELIKMKSESVKKVSAKEYYGGNNIDWETRYKKDLETRCSKFKDGFFIYDVLGVLYKNDYIYYLKDEYEESVRSNPDLIDVVERLKEKANGKCAKLEIVEIPDNVKYFIEEYDGMEHISEEHRTWG